MRLLLSDQLAVLTGTRARSRGLLSGLIHCGERVRTMTTAKIVLADDHPAITAACRKLLEPEFEVAVAVDCGRGALEATEEHDPDVLVLDIEMPDMNGLEVIEVLTKRGTRARVVVLTLHQDRAIQDGAFDLGALGYVTKSRLARDLPAAIRAALAGETFSSLPE